MSALRTILRVALVLTVALTPACKNTADEPLPNVRLGMSPRDIRDRFEPSSSGEWQTSIGAGDDTVLSWTSRQETSRVRHARFEFHLGMLVAIRATLRDPSGVGHIDATPKTITARGPGAEGGTDVTILARDCPTHHAEAEDLAAKAAPR